MRQQFAWCPSGGQPDNARGAGISHADGCAQRPDVEKRRTQRPFSIFQSRNRKLPVVVRCEGAPTQPRPSCCPEWAVGEHRGAFLTARCASQREWQRRTPPSDWKRKRHHYIAREDDIARGTATSNRHVSGSVSLSCGLITQYAAAAADGTSSAFRHRAGAPSGDRREVERRELRRAGGRAGGKPEIPIPESRFNEFSRSITAPCI